MSHLRRLYRSNLGLLTDLYQLTMAYGYWRSGMAETEAAFHLFFRRHPFEGGFSVAAGMAAVAELLDGFGFTPEELAYLGEQRGDDGEPLFDRAFLDHLGQLELAVEVDAVAEGTAVFPLEPLVRVTGPILHCQLLETPLLNLINFPTLIATKAARICLAAEGDPVLEFGLRRAQGIDGAVTAARATYIGGIAATSNVLAGRLFDIPIKGTHAHSWVMAFDDELEAFEAWAEAMPNNCIFLVDTYDTLEGVEKAIAAGRRLRERGHEMMGVRLDSGDLAYLSIEARKLLDAGGFPEAKIYASSDLDERLIRSLKRQGARIDVWGIGTRLVTAYDEPAMGGVYKISAVRGGDGAWRHRIKLSERAIKISNPGVQQVRRFSDGDGLIADVIYDRELGIDDEPTLIDPTDMTRRKSIPRGTPYEDLLRPLWRPGMGEAEAAHRLEAIAGDAALAAARQRARDQLAALHPGIKRFENPHEYPVGLEERLFELRTNLVLAARGFE